ncbi:MAG: hypothetical protein NC320_09940 [Clostridium sp.]|nr:hypothetical protein [Clostridium sp.]MCM1548015.1 hypothetical protein [Ruminococcus sp.]
MKKLKVVFALFMTLLCGCSFSTGMDNLIIPPRLSSQQEHIYNALKSYAGTNINLKYPKSGDYLSAFIIADIDGDSDDEAIVFYEKTAVSAENISLRINILDCIDGKWQSVCDHAADGSEVEKVVITKLGSNDRINIIVGCSLINQTEKVVSIYHYENRTLNTTFENNYYSLFDAADLNGDGEKELFVALSQGASRDAAAQVYYLSENGEYTKTSSVLDESYTDYQKITYGTLEDGKTGIYLDAVVGSETIITNIFSIDENDALKHIFTPDSKKLETLRPSAYTCGDIDGDGTVEIPIPQPFPGYSEKDENPINLTKWHEFKNDKLFVKMCGYLSITNSYAFIFPDGWTDNVTAYADSEKNYVSFGKITGKSPDEEPSLMTVRAIPEKNESEMQLLLSEGYELLRSRENKLFLVKINQNDKMTDQPTELMFRFKFYD